MILNKAAKILVLALFLPGVSAAQTGTVDVAEAVHADGPNTDRLAGTVLWGRAGDNEVVNYTRIIRLQHSGLSNGTLLATFEHSFKDGTPGYLIIRKSVDDGASWSTLAKVPDPNGWPVMYQPFLFETPRKIGKYPKGTILLVANSLRKWRGNDITRFNLFSSTDQGRTWTRGSEVVSGAGGRKGIWEPFLLMDGKDNLDMYFSDERESKRWSQSLIGYPFDESRNVFDTSAEIPVVKSGVRSDRPGMITIARTGDSHFVAAFEVCGPRYKCAVHLKTSPDGRTWGKATDIGAGITAKDGKVPYGNPLIAWSPLGGVNGQLSLAAGRINRYYSDVILVNTDPHFRRSAWQWIPKPIYRPTRQYSMDILPSADGGSRLRVAASTWPEVLTGSATSGVLPYADTFKTGQDFGWLDFGGKWIVSAEAGRGVYKDTLGVPGAKAIAGSTGWRDYQLKADIRLDAAGQAGLLVRASNPSAGAEALNAYYVRIDSKTHTLVAGKSSGSWTSITSSPLKETDVRKWYTLKVTARGPAFTVMLVRAADQTPVGQLDFYDKSFETGAIGLRDDNTPSSWRNVSVTSVSKAK